jgi:RNA polymerase sigma factor (sigma-70 family)
MIKEKKPIENQTIEELLDTYKGYIYKVAQSLTNDAYINQELIQEGKIHLFLAKERFNPENGNFHSYIGRYIKGGMLMYLNRKTHKITYTAEKIKEFLSQEGLDFPSYHPFDEPVEDGYTLAELICDDFDDTSDDDESLLKKQKIQQKINKLNRKQQEMIRLKFVEGLDYPMIAEKLGKKTANVTQQIKKIITTIKCKLSTLEIENNPYIIYHSRCTTKGKKRWVVAKKIGYKRILIGKFETQYEADKFLKKYIQENGI